MPDSSASMARGMAHIIDDDVRLARGMARTLQAADIEAHCYEDVARYLLANPPGPGCVVLDICMPGPTGLDLYEALMTHEPPRPVIFMTAVDDVSLSVEAMRSGAHDFLWKPVETDRLLGAVRSALTLDASRRAAHAEAARIRQRLRTLTDIERAIFDRAARGQRNKRVAAELGMGIRTIGFHRARLMRKLKVASVVELVHLDVLLQADEAARQRQADCRQSWRAVRNRYAWLHAGVRGALRERLQ